MSVYQNLCANDNNDNNASKSSFVFLSSNQEIVLMSVAENGTIDFSEFCSVIKRHQHNLATADAQHAFKACAHILLTYFLMHLLHLFAYSYYVSTTRKQSSC